mmetsp:Transcript_19025/g.51185  ORF Transcript_19025/g.51185 Transcript_19025/m.51185 type:complete len:208 (-) Transcript_19025:1258-1881(-)
MTTTGKRQLFARGLDPPRGSLHSPGVCEQSSREQWRTRSARIGRALPVAVAQLERPRQGAAGGTRRGRRPPRALAAPRRPTNALRSPPSSGSGAGAGLARRGGMVGRSGREQEAAGRGGRATSPRRGLSRSRPLRSLARPWRCTAGSPCGLSGRLPSRARGCQRRTSRAHAARRPQGSGAVGRRCARPPPARPGEQSCGSRPGSRRG